MVRSVIVRGAQENREKILIHPPQTSEIMIASLFKAILAFLAMLLVAIGIAAIFLYKKFRTIINQFRNSKTGNEFRSGENIIVDHRSETQRQKKVIGDDEGEYVDFTENRQ